MLLFEDTSNKMLSDLAQIFSIYITELHLKTLSSSKFDKVQNKAHPNSYARTSHVDSINILKNIRHN